MTIMNAIPTTVKLTSVPATQGEQDGLDAAVADLESLVARKIAIAERQVKQDAEYAACLARIKSLKSRLATMQPTPHPGKRFHVGIYMDGCDSADRTSMMSCHEVVELLKTVERLRDGWPIIVEENYGNDGPGRPGHYAEFYVEIATADRKPIDPRTRAWMYRATGDVFAYDDADLKAFR